MSNKDSELEQWYSNQDIPYVKPFYMLDMKDERAIQDWFNDTEGDLYNFYHPMFREQRNNLQMFLASGLNPKYLSAEVADFVNYNSDTDQTPGLYINELFHYTMEQVSLVTANELTPHILPSNDDYNDKIACKASKQWLDSMNYDLETDLMRVRWEIQKKVFGECFVIVEWDDQAGDIHPDAFEHMEEDLPMMDEDGQIVRAGEPGKEREVKLKKVIRIGDICFANPAPYNVQVEPAIRYENSNWIYWKEWVDTDYLRKKYKNKMFKDPDERLKLYNESGAVQYSTNQTCIFKFYHKPHEFLPFGRYIVRTEEAILINKPIKSKSLLNSKTFPVARFTDLDYGFGCRGIPILYRNLRNLHEAYNKLSNQIYENLEIESPKILVHVTAGFDGRRMPTGITVFEWEGQHPPTIITPSTNTSSIFKYREELKKNMDEMARQTPMVRGDVPNSQLDTWVAFQHFEDLRVQQAAPDIKGHIKTMERLFKLMITKAADHYDPADGRMIKIMGKHNQFQLKYFDPINLMKAYDVKITTTGNLANSKAARNELMLKIKKDFPNLVQDELFIDTLGLSHSEKFVNAITNAVNTAESENQDMLNGLPVLPPERYEDLIVHWDSHRIPMQTLDYKLAPAEVHELFERHMTLTEKLMYEAAKESEIFAQRMGNLKQFPLFFTPTPTNAPEPEENLGGGNENGQNSGFAPVATPGEEPSPVLNTGT